MVDLNDILISEEIVSEPGRVRSVLAHRVRELLDEYRDGERRVARLVIPLQPLDSFAWLNAQELLPQVYWHARDDDTATAAAGTADRCFGGPDASYGDLRAQLDLVLPKSDARVRYYGGFRFDRKAARSPEWDQFGTFTFVLPRFEYSVRGEQALLACNLLLPRDIAKRDQILREIELLAFPDGVLNGELPLPGSRMDLPDLEGWTRNVEWALREFRHGRMKKIVLARRADFKFDEQLEPMLVLKRLEEATANCFRFAFKLERDSTFLGATPERLFLRSGRRVWTEALAGTRPRGATPGEDARLLRDLLGSEKDQREHAYVRESISEALIPLCESFYIDPVASEMKLTRGWHLLSRSRGMLRRDIHGSEVMRALHPTPAVGGYPTDAAMKGIREREPFDRGWYAGPVGWIGARGAEFAVALRCGLVKGRELSLFSGAGIVEGSRPADEWKEIEQKVSDFIRIFGLD